MSQGNHGPRSAEWRQQMSERMRARWAEKRAQETASLEALDRVIRCFVCSLPETSGKVLRFGLRDSRRQTTAGGIFLCQRCWADTRRVNPRRGRRHRHLRAVA